MKVENPVARSERIKLAEEMLALLDAAKSRAAALASDPEEWPLVDLVDRLRELAHEINVAYGAALNNHNQLVILLNRERARRMIEGGAQ